MVEVAVEGAMEEEETQEGMGERLPMDTVTLGGRRGREEAIEPRTGMPGLAGREELGVAGVVVGADLATTVER